METETRNKCPICLENIDNDGEYLPCAHHYHMNCINDWIREKPLCPICKIPIYISSPEHLKIYNEYNRIQNIITEEETKIFQQISNNISTESNGENNQQINYMDIIVPIFNNENYGNTMRNIINMFTIISSTNINDEEESEQGA